MIMEAKMKDSGPQQTAVTVSMHSTNAFCVWYLESDNEYSFHNCPNKSCMLPIRLKL